MTAAGVDPWRLRDQLTSGDPEEIYAMARAFNAAAAQQGDAVALTTKGLHTVAEGYQVDNATPVDVDAEVAQTRTDLGGGWERLGQIAKILSDVASDLAQRTTAAQAQVSTLEWELTAIQRNWWRIGQSLPSDDADSAKSGYVADAVRTVKIAGGPLARSVEEYETALAGHVKALADLGYLAPSALDEGPGDVDVPEPKAAADRTVAAARNNDRSGLDESTSYLALLNEKGAAGVPLTTAERDWLRAYYERVTPHLPEIKTWADGLNDLEPHHAGARPDPANPATALAGRVADGLLTLSQRVPFEDLPDSVRQIVDGDLGTQDPAYSKFHGRLPVTAPPDGDDNLRRFAGFVDFMDDYASPTAKPGDDLAQHLGDAAIRWKQQINVMYTNYAENVEAANHYNAGPGDSDNARPPSPGEWATLFPDELSSDALGLVARDNGFSNHWLVEDHEARRQLMALNWQDGHGAANVMLAATLPSGDPADPVSSQQAASAALAVVRDAASDYDGLAHMANSHVKAAIGVMASAYVDSFAVDPTGPPGVRQIELPNGQQVTGLSLDNDTYANFLKYLAASDPNVFGHFSAQAETRGTWYVEQAIRAGHADPGDPEFQQAVKAAMRLHGALDGASAGVLNDTVLVHGDTGDMAQQLAQAKAVANHEKFATIAGGIGNLADVVGLVPGATGVASNVFRIGVEALTGTFLHAPDDPDYANNIQQLQSDIENLAKSQAAQSTALGQIKQEMAEIVFDAHQHAGQPVPGPGVGSPVVPDPDGDMPEHYRDTLYDLMPDSIQTKASDVMQQLAGQTQSRTSTGQGSGYNSGWSIGEGAEVGSLNDGFGNWSNVDDRYRIYYGQEQRYDYAPPVFSPDRRPERWLPQVPDGKLDTKTAGIPEDRIPTEG